jgi:DNA polymerase
MQPYKTDQELESYWQWWRMVGVEHSYAEEPCGWLEAVNEESPNKAPEPALQPKAVHPDPQQANITRQQGNINDSVSPAHIIADKPKSLPDNLEDIAQWWKASDDIAMMSGSGPRILPALISAPKLLMISDMPDQDDNETLFTGASGVLLNNMLNAAQIKRDTTALLSLWPQYSLAPEMEMDRQTYWAEIAQHLIALINPHHIMLCGKFANLIVTGKDLAENRRSLPNINHNQRSIPASVSFHPRTLLARSSLKRAAWNDWLKFRESLHEIGAVQP